MGCRLQGQRRLLLSRIRILEEHYKLRDGVYWLSARRLSSHYSAYQIGEIPRWYCYDQPHDGPKPSPRRVA
jgi:hypothetical protein